MPVSQTIWAVTLDPAMPRPHPDSRDLVFSCRASTKETSKGSPYWDSCLYDAFVLNGEFLKGSPTRSLVFTSPLWSSQESPSTHRWLGDRSVSPLKNLDERTHTIFKGLRNIYRDRTIDSVIRQRDHEKQPKWICCDFRRKSKRATLNRIRNI